LASEWLKMRSLRLYPLLLAAIVIVSVVVGAFMAIIGGESVADAQAESQYSVIFYSSALTTWAFAGIAANFVGIEFSGVGQTTFTATVRRTRVFAAKLVLIAAAGAFIGVVSSVTTAAATQGVLALRGFEPLDLTDPGLIRAVLILVGASMAVQGLLAAGFAVLTRSGVWGLIVAGLISLLPVSFAPLLGQWYSEHIPRWLPGAAVESLAGVAAPEGYGYLPVPLALTAVAAWLVVVTTIATLHLRRIDLR
jgi:hypothetical protein